MGEPSVGLMCCEVTVCTELEMWAGCPKNWRMQSSQISEAGNAFPLNHFFAGVMQGLRASLGLVDGLATIMQQRLTPTALACSRLLPVACDQSGVSVPGSHLLADDPLQRRLSSSVDAVTASSVQQHSNDTHEIAFAKLTPRAVVEKLDQFIVGPWNKT